jgi:transcription initiation factor TFIID subunit TAF12
MSARSILKERVDKRRIEAEASMMQKFPRILEPKSEEEKRFVPPLRLQSLVRKVCGDRVKLATETDDAIEQLTGKFVGDAIAFAISMARRKKLKEVDPSDIALFLKSTWNINIPGFNSGKVATYRCIAPKPEERSKIAAVRKENFAEGKKYQVAGNQGDKDRSIKK